jgi:hypothetical protein
MNWDTTCSYECSIDFLTSKHNCCDHSLLYVRIVGIVVIAFALFAAPLKAVFTYYRYKTPMPNKTAQTIQCWYGFFAFLYDLTYLIHGILKVVSPMDYLIGHPHKTSGTDVNFFVNSCSFVLLMYFIGLNFAEFLKNTVKIFPSEVRERIMYVVGIVKTTSIAVPIFGILFSIFPFFVYGSPRHSDIFNTVYLVGYWGVITYQGLQNVMLMTIVTREMRKVLDAAAATNKQSGASNELTEKTQKTLAQLNQTMMLTSARVAVSIVTWAAFTFAPELRDRFTYYYMMHYFITYFTGLLGLRGLWNFGGPKPNVVVPVTPSARPMVNELAPGGGTAYAVVDAKELVEEKLEEEKA